MLEAEEAIRHARGATCCPFPLTNAQKRAVREIADDLASGRAMARLLQGDVGSGKTVVAGLALLIAAKNGAQGALMAPTEILAEQHAKSLASWLTGAGVRLGLLTGRVREPARRRLLEQLAAGGIDVLVGTHALIETPVRFHAPRAGRRGRAASLRRGAPRAPLPQGRVPARARHDGDADPAVPRVGRSTASSTSRCSTRSRPAAPRS